MIIMYTETIQRYIFHVSKMVLGCTRYITLYNYYSSMMISTSIPIRKKRKWQWYERGRFPVHIVQAATPEVVRRWPFARPCCKTLRRKRSLEDGLRAAEIVGTHKMGSPITPHELYIYISFASKWDSGHHFILGYSECVFFGGAMGLVSQTFDIQLL